MSFRLSPVFLLTIVVVTGCPRPGPATSSSSGTSCATGTNGCPCGADHRCDAPLACGPAGTCMAAQGGQPGDSCDTDRPCGSFQGTTLECSAGTCGLPGCATAAAGCPCGPASSCGTGLTCNASLVCEPSGCTPGSASCACRPGAACDDGLTCVAGACHAASGVLSVVTDNAQVRGCNVLVREGARQILGVTFPAGVKGHVVRRGGLVSFAVIPTSDVALASLASITLSGAARAQPSDVTLVSAACNGHDGEALGAPGVEVRAP